MRREVRGRRRGSMTTLTPSPARPTTSVWTLANNLPLMPSLLAASVQVQHGFLGGAGISFPLRISVLHARAHGEVTCLRGAARGALLAAEVLHTQRASRSQSRAPQTPTIAGLAVWPWPRGASASSGACSLALALALVLALASAPAQTGSLLKLRRCRR